MKYYVPEFNLNKLIKLVNRLSKKTKVEFSYNVNDIKQDSILVDDGVYAPYNTIAVELDVDYKVGDYEIVAELEHHKKGNIIRQVNMNYEVPTQYRTCEPYCEHCNKLRQRANTFLLVDNNHNFKQVGKSCLNDYTGYDALKVIELVSGVGSLLSVDYDDEEFISFVKTTRWYELKEMANKFYQLIKNEGYNKERPFENLDKYQYNKDLEKEVEEILNVVNTDWYNENSNYCFNISVLLDMQYIESKHWKLLLSFINSALTYLMNKNVKNEYIGNIGDRIEFTIKSVKTLFRVENYHSYNEDDYVYTYRILTDNDYILIWKTTKELENGMKIKATIKEYKNYKDEKQTVITRGTIDEKALEELKAIKLEQKRLEFEKKRLEEEQKKSEESIKNDWIANYCEEHDLQPYWLDENWSKGEEAWEDYQDDLEIERKRNFITKYMEEHNLNPLDSASIKEAKQVWKEVSKQR